MTTLSFKTSDIILIGCKKRLDQRITAIVIFAMYMSQVMVIIAVRLILEHEFYLLTTPGKGGFNRKTQRREGGTNIQFCQILSKFA